MANQLPKMANRKKRRCLPLAGVLATAGFGGKAGLTGGAATGAPAATGVPLALVDSDITFVSPDPKISRHGEFCSPDDEDVNSVL